MMIDDRLGTFAQRTRRRGPHARGNRPSGRPRQGRATALKWLAVFVGLLAACIGHTAAASEETPLQHWIEQLRSAVGEWDVTTEFLEPDGSVARSVRGTYQFAWVVPDRVVSGRSEIPELHQVSAILLYLDEARNAIEMASVGGDGRLWVMTGPLGGEVRTTPEFPTASGGRGMLRFTRFNVAADSFESRMAYTDDGGVTWTPGNHQVFRRVGADAG